MKAKKFSRRILALGVVTVIVAFLGGQHRAPDLLFLLLAGLAFYGELRAVKIPGFGLFNAGEGVHLAVACLYGPAAGGLFAALLGLAADRSRGRQPEVTTFNLGWALTTFSAVGISFQTGGYAAAALAFVFTAALLQSFGEQHFSGVPLHSALRHQVQGMVLVAPASLGIVFLIGGLQQNPWSVILLAFPLELVNALARLRKAHEELSNAYRQLETTQAELVATGRQAALGVMAAGIAHEINNPLGAAMTYLYLVKNSLSSEKAEANAVKIEKALARCQKVVAQMLKYSRRPAGGEAHCDPFSVIEDALMFSGRKLADVVQLEEEMAALPNVGMDPAEMVQVVTNLLTNAYDATQGQGPIEVRAELKGGRIVLTVSDGGPGVPQELQSQIFEPFFTTKSVGSGTGLGLSISQSLARGAGGDLKLRHSKPGSTVFALELPVAR